MFTGLIEETGVLESVRKGARSAVLRIRASKVTDGLKTGDSVAVNGVCLTAVTCDSTGFTADVMHETLRRSSLGALAPGSRVNLERAMPADGRFGGHMVAGHVDGTGIIRAIKKDDNAVWYTISAEPKVLRYIVEQGSSAIDGISPTVAAVTETEVSASVMPPPAAVTTLSERKAGDAVNLENDIVGKYVEKLLGLQAPGNAPAGSAGSRGLNKSPSSGKAAAGGITRGMLAENGFLM